MSKVLGNEIIYNEDEQPYLALQYLSNYESYIHYAVIRNTLFVLPFLWENNRIYQFNVKLLSKLPDTRLL